MKSKILIFTDHFLPGNRAGGPVSSIANLVKLLNDTFEIVIVTRNHDFGIIKPYNDVNHDEIVNYKEYKVFYMSNVNKKNVLILIKEFNPNIVFLNSFFSYFSRIVLMLSFISKLNTKIILAPRGELQKNAFAIKKFKKTIYLFFFKLLKIDKKIEFFSTDKIETSEIKINFQKDPIATLPNVPKIITPYKISKNKNELKIIFLSRIRNNKNLHYALEILKNLKNIELLFDIYGPIEDQEYWLNCEKSIKSLPNNIVVSYKGEIEPDNIMEVMSRYHALLLPTKTENFGHVIVEAMFVGLVPIISNQTPWLELEKHNAGWDISLDDKNKYMNVIEKLYLIDNDEFQKLSYGSSKYIMNKLKIDKLKEKYIRFFHSTIKDKNV